MEGTGLKSHALGEATLPISDANTVLDKAEVETVRFESSLRVKHDHTGLGSCMDFSANGEGSELKSQVINGRVFCRVGWGRTSDGAILAPPADKWSPPKTKE